MEHANRTAYLLDVKQHEGGRHNDGRKQRTEYEANPELGGHVIAHASHMSSPEDRLGVYEVKDAFGNVEISLPNLFSETTQLDSGHDAVRQTV